MSELYWLGVFGNLHDFCVVLAILAAFAFFALGFLLFMSDDDDEFPPYKKKCLSILYSFLCLELLWRHSFLLQRTFLSSMG